MNDFIIALVIVMNYLAGLIVGYRIGISKVNKLNDYINKLEKYLEDEARR